MVYLTFLQLLSRIRFLCVSTRVLTLQKNTMQLPSRLKSLYPGDMDRRFFRKFGTRIQNYTPQ